MNVFVAELPAASDTFTVTTTPLPFGLDIAKVVFAGIFPLESVEAEIPDVTPQSLLEHDVDTDSTELWAKPLPATDTVSAVFFLVVLGLIVMEIVFVVAEPADVVLVQVVAAR